jgi:hypothetical protein
MMFSLAIEKQPQEAADKNDDARIEHRNWLYRWLKLTAQKKQSQQGRDDDRNNQTDHPCRKE